MKTFEINGNKYQSKEFTFGTVCDMEDRGISMADIEKKPFATFRAYFSICSGLDMEDAGAEMNNHVIKGGNFDKLGEALADEMEKSDFFRALDKTAETENREGEAEKK